MPPRNVNELDTITLHNIAIMNMEEDPTGGFEKLTFLISSDGFPRETFVNLCLLYLKYEVCRNIYLKYNIFLLKYYDFAADLLAENTDMTFKYMDAYIYEFIEAKIVQQTAPEAAFKKFEELAGTLIEQLRRLVKEVQENRRSQKDEQVKKKVQEYDATLEKYSGILLRINSILFQFRYVPVLMAQANIYWLQENYSAVEKIFRKSVEFCNDNEIWKLNVSRKFYFINSYYLIFLGCSCSFYAR
jgi:tetratricopeptide repeat protein 30